MRMLSIPNIIDYPVFSASSYQIFLQIMVFT